MNVLEDAPNNSWFYTPEIFEGCGGLNRTALDVPRSASRIDSNGIFFISFVYKCISAHVATAQ
jgi:hypothetical protein